jgi:hypothetical protein
LLAFGVGYERHKGANRPADDDKAFLTIILTIIEALDRKRILENRLREIEAHAMDLQVGLGFPVVHSSS